MALKTGDFVEIEYTGMLDDGTVFDTTNAAVAKQHNIGSQRAKYGAITICLGEHQLIRGIDEELNGKDVGETYKFTFPPERAFGKKNAQLIQLIPTQKFMKEGIRPMHGLQINVDGMLGTIKSVSGGRTLVDFNHPLSGREVRYEVKVTKVIADASEKLKAFVTRSLQVEPKIAVADGNATITLPFELPSELRSEYLGKVQKAIPELKGIELKVEKSA